MTGRIHIDLFTTLDGVAQAPGGREEDTSGDFPYGGWQAPFPDEVIGKTIWEGISGLDALLLGRRVRRPAQPLRQREAERQAQRGVEAEQGQCLPEVLDPAAAGIQR